MSLRDKLRSVVDRKVVRVETPEWAPDVDHVWVRTLSVRERLDMNASRRAVESRGLDYWQAVLVTHVVSNEAGNQREFEDADAEWIQDKAGHVLDRIITVAFDMVQPNVSDAEKNS